MNSGNGNFVELSKYLNNTPYNKIGVLICYSINPYRYNIDYFDNNKYGLNLLIEKLNKYKPHNAFIEDVYVITTHDNKTRYFTLDSAMEFYAITEPVIPEPLEPVYLNNFDIEFHSKNIDLTQLSDQVLNFKYMPNKGPGCETIEIGFNEYTKSNMLIAYPLLLDLLHKQEPVRIRLMPKNIKGERGCVFEFEAKLEYLTHLIFDIEAPKQDIMKIQTIWNNVKY